MVAPHGAVIILTCQFNLVLDLMRASLTLLTSGADRDDTCVNFL